MYNVFEENKEKLIKYLKDKQEILAAFLFGSFCDGTYNERSDIDIAVLYSTKIDPLEHDAMSIDIEKIFENTKIDYINLEDINLFF